MSPGDRRAVPADHCRARDLHLRRLRLPTKGPPGAGPRPERHWGAGSGADRGHQKPPGPDRVLRHGRCSTHDRAQGRYSGWFDIGGRRLFLRCTGHHSPTVVFEGGLTTDWYQLQNRLSGFTRVCSYDHPNGPWSRSDLAPTPHRPRRRG